MKTQSLISLFVAALAALVFALPASAARPDASTAVRGTPVTRIMALGNINMRSGPGTWFARTGMLDMGEMRTVIGVSNDYNWWRVSCADGIGWVSANPNYTKPVAWRR